MLKLLTAMQCAIRYAYGPPKVTEAREEAHISSGEPPPPLAATRLHEGDAVGFERFDDKFKLSAQLFGSPAKELQRSPSVLLSFPPTQPIRLLPNHPLNHHSAAPHRPPSLNPIYPHTFILVSITLKL